jgi:CubicO group peptidase (beta-lactamase class C family)
METFRYKSCPIRRRVFLRSTAALVAGACPSLNSTQAFSQEPATATANGKNFQPVVDFLERERAARSYPGRAIVASQHGRIVFEHFTGTYHNMLGQDEPYHSDVRSLFYSYSKGISATVIMMAHQDGLIDIDATVASYVPEFAANGKDKITIRHVLTHSAGIPSAPQPFKSVRDEEEWQAAIDTVCQAELEWEPGSRTAYHGLAMLIAAECVRRQFQRNTWNAICHERLFGPILAKTLTFRVPADKSLLSCAPDNATGQDTAQPMLAGHPAGGCFGTLRDALRVLHLHLSGGSWKGKSLLTPEAYAEMHRVQYAEEIAAAFSRGEVPRHDNWAVGWLLRGTGPARGGSGWFGFRDQQNPNIFGHAGIDTVIGVADPKTDVAFMFHTTRSPKSAEETVRLRNEATNRVLAAFATS